MPDEMDLAQTAEDEFTRHALDGVIHRHREEPLEKNGLRVCLDCEAPIGPARLEANPEAVRCIRCQEKEERR